jgi:hypothetical protein
MQLNNQKINKLEVVVNNQQESGELQTVLLIWSDIPALKGRIIKIPEEKELIVWVVIIPCKNHQKS